MLKTQRPLLRTLKSQAGFTFIELMVVIVIIGLLSVAGVVSYQRASIAARDSKRKANLATVQQALVLYRSATGTYPNPGGHVYAKYNSAVNTLQAAGYLNDISSLIDPKDGELPYGYRYVGTNSSFQLCAYTEKDGSDFCLSNP